VALDGGPDGLDIARRVAAEARDWLAPGGRLLIEARKRQASSLAEFLARSGLPATVANDEERDTSVVIQAMRRAGGS
jgi:release factor glutamine methyltransferase